MLLKISELQGNQNKGDGAAHEKWLEEGSPDYPTHLHISGDQLTSR